MVAFEAGVLFLQSSLVPFPYRPPPVENRIHPECIPWDTIRKEDSERREGEARTAPIRFPLPSIHFHTFRLFRVKALGHLVLVVIRSTYRWVERYCPRTLADAAFRNVQPLTHGLHAGPVAGRNANQMRTEGVKDKAPLLGDSVNA